MQFASLGPLASPLQHLQDVQPLHWTFGRFGLTASHFPSRPCAPRGPVPVLWALGTLLAPPSRATSLCRAVEGKMMMQMKAPCGCGLPTRKRSSVRVAAGVGRAPQTQLVAEISALLSLQFEAAKPPTAPRSCNHCFRRVFRPSLRCTLLPHLRPCRRRPRFTLVRREASDPKRARARLPATVVLPWAGTWPAGHSFPYINAWPQACTQPQLGDWPAAHSLATSCMHASRRTTGAQILGVALLPGFLPAALVRRSVGYHPPTTSCSDLDSPTAHTHTNYTTSLPPLHAARTLPEGRLLPSHAACPVSPSCQASPRVTMSAPLAARAV